MCVICVLCVMSLSKPVLTVSILLFSALLLSVQVHLILFKNYDKYWEKFMYLVGVTGYRLRIHPRFK